MVRQKSEHEDMSNVILNQSTADHCTSSKTQGQMRDARISDYNMHMLMVRCTNGITPQFQYDDLNKKRLW